MSFLNDSALPTCSEADTGVIEPSAELVRTLTAVFARVLGASPVLPESDFFELGGDSILAMALAFELQESCRMTVPPTLLFDAPTPAALAQAMGERAESPAGPLVLLKKGSQEPPVFLVPGITGSPIEFQSFAKLVNIPNPIYGLQARGLDGKEQPLRDVRDMATHLLPSIRARQPNGPYLLAGNSMGGFAALELGCALLGAEETVALLALFDTMINRNHLSLGQRFAVWGQRARHHAAAARTRPLRYAASYIAGRSHGRASKALPEHQTPVLWRSLQDVVAGAHEAAGKYRPRYFPGTITFFAAIDDADWPIYPEITWCPLAKTLRVHRINGDHVNLFRAHAAEVAGQFAEAVRSALETTSALKDPPLGRRRRPAAIGAAEPSVAFLPDPL